MKIVVNDSEALPCVVASVRSTHKVLNDKANINQCDFVIWGKVTLFNISY
uniref:Uncharacterized protein n=1 Tax=Anguilla anguilla TaxID=7936 RepID=A0A0E9W5L8_ANGAN